MLKKTITYTDYNGKMKTNTFFFNLTATELREIKRGPLYEMEKIIERIESMENPDEELSYDEKDEYQEKIGNILRNIIIQSYGIKSEDGERFIKRIDDHRYGVGEQFVETMAYDALYADLLSDLNNVILFIKGIIPPEYGDNIDKALREQNMNNEP